MWQCQGKMVQFPSFLLLAQHVRLYRYEECYAHERRNNLLYIPGGFRFNQGLGKQLISCDSAVPASVDHFN